MSRAQSPSRDSAATLALLAEKVLQITDAIQDLRDQVENLRANKREEREEIFMDIRELEKLGTLIRSYDKAIRLIPEFDGSNVESFISHVQVAVKRLEPEQHELLLCSIIAEKLTNRAKGTIRIDATTSFVQLFEKLRFLYGKREI